MLTSESNPSRDLATTLSYAVGYWNSNSKSILAVRIRQRRWHLHGTLQLSIRCGIASGYGDRNFESAQPEQQL